MKTLRAMVMGLALLLACGASQAAPLTKHNNLTKDEVMNTYLNAVVHGKLMGIDDAIADDAEFDMKRGGNVTVLHKSQIMNALKSGANIEQDCQCTKSILQDMDGVNIIKVDMKYADFTRTDVITAQNTGGEWKITKVETSFK